MPVKKHAREHAEHHPAEDGHEFTKKKLSDSDSTVEPSHHSDKDLKMPAKEKSKIDRELQEIYENSDGSLPDMQTFEKRKRAPFATAFIFLLAACVFLGVVAWAGFFFFQPEIRFQEDKVILSISGGETTSLGEPVTYRVRYRNDQRVPLAKAALQVRYPAGFVFATSSVPATNNTGDEWALGALPEGGSGYIDISGAMYGNLNQTQSFRVFLNYTPSNVSSEFQKVATTNVTLSSSPFEITMEGPEQVVAGKEYTVQMHIHQKIFLSGIANVLIVEPPSNFSKKNSTPESDRYAQYKWTIPANKSDFTVSLTGVWAGAEERAILSARIAGQQKGKEDSYDLAKANFDVPVVQRTVAAHIVINGMATGTLAVVPGELLRATVVVENTGQTPVKNVRLRALFDAPSIKNKSIFNWLALDDTQDGTVAGEQIDTTTRRGSVLWDKNQVAVLRELAPGKDASVEFSLPIKGVDDPVIAELSDMPVTIMAAAEVQYDSNEGKEILAGNQLQMVLSANASLSVEHGVNGSAHTVSWVLSNTYHNLTSVHLEADAYGDVSWNDKGLVVPAGKAVFDAEKKRLTWDIEKMPGGVDVLALQFALDLQKDNPTQKDLISKVRGKFIDAVTGKDIVIAGDEVPLHP